MDLDKQAEIARLMTGSKLSDQEMFELVRSTSQATREKVCPQVDQMVKDRNMPFDKAYPLVRDGFNQIAVNFNMDPAVLFWIYMDWFKHNK